MDICIYIEGGKQNLSIDEKKFILPSIAYTCIYIYICIHIYIYVYIYMYIYTHVHFEGKTNRYVHVYI